MITDLRLVVREKRVPEGILYSTDLFYKVEGKDMYARVPWMETHFGALAWLQSLPH